MPADRFDLYEVAQSLRRAAPTLAAGALAGAILAAVVSYFVLPYSSEGIYGLGGIVNRDPVLPNQPTPWPKILQYGKGLPVPELKTEYPRLDGEGFRRFLATRKVATDATLERAIKRLANPDTRPEILQPQYGSTRADLRELGEQAKPVENSALGMRVAVTSRDPDAAFHAAGLVGEFVGQAVFDSQARGLVARRLEQYESQKLAFDNDLITHRFNITTTGEKVSRLRALQREFPDAGGNARQVVSIAEGGSRYLTPSAQVVGLEATVTDLRQQIATTERWRRKAELLAAYYRGAQAAVEESGDSRAALKALGGLIDRSFPESKDDDTLREARNDAALDLYALRTLREQGLRFVSGPTPGWRDESRLWKNALAGAVLGFVLVAAYVLLAHAIERRDA